MANKCTGNAHDHCCYFAGKVCPHLEENTVPGRRWACGLLRQLGSWDQVHASLEWRRDVHAVASNIKTLGPNYRCGEWPPKGQTCATCGVVGG